MVASVDIARGAQVGATPAVTLVDISHLTLRPGMTGQVQIVK